MGFEYQRTTDHSSKDRHSIHGRYTLSKAKSMNKTVLCTVLEFWWSYSPAMSLHLASVLRLLSEWTSGIMCLLRGMGDEDRRMSWSPWAASLAYAWGGGGGRTKRPSHKQSGGLGLVPTVVFWHHPSIVVPTCLHVSTHAHARKKEKNKSDKSDILFQNKHRRCVRLTWGELSSTTVRHEEDQPSETLVSSGRSRAC